MEIACSVNAIIPEDNYDKVLELSNQLSKSFNGLEKEPRDCQTEALKFIHNRYLLTLHIPFAIRDDPKFSYSQNVSLTSALSILEQITSASVTLEQPRTASTGNSPNGSPSHSHNNNHAEKICINAMHASGIRTPNLVCALPGVEQRVVALIERFIKIAEERLRTTQFAGKAFLIPRMVLAYHRISADPEVRTKEEKERRLLEAGKVIAEICFSIFCSNPEVARVL
ncbi:hypothetical protein BFW01_g3984 [Lasiodiplodia theobromae]|nr:hypothetical protein BFW01_g3984 [Lasiodiplodia theobromae]